MRNAPTYVNNFIYRIVIYSELFFLFVFVIGGGWVYDMVYSDIPLLPMYTIIHIHDVYYIITLK